MQNSFTVNYSQQAKEATVSSAKRDSLDQCLLFRKFYNDN
jgi:hypothetical protein